MVLEDHHIVGILVWFGCTWLDIGVWFNYLSEWNLPTGTSAPVSNYFSDPFPRIRTSSESKPSTFVNSDKFYMLVLAPFQGQILPVILYCGFHTGHQNSTALHRRNLFSGELNIFYPLSRNFQSGCGVEEFKISTVRSHNTLTIAGIYLYVCVCKYNF